MLDNILNSWPQGLLAAAAILGGVAMLFLFSPPHSLCQSQIELFQQHESGFLFLKKKQKQSGFEHLVSICKEANAPGGCFELFRRWRLTLNRLKSSSFECSAEIAALTRVKRPVQATLQLMLQIDSPQVDTTTTNDLIANNTTRFETTKSNSLKHRKPSDATPSDATPSTSQINTDGPHTETPSWLDAADKNLFCELKKFSTRHYGPLKSKSQSRLAQTCPRQ